MTILGPWAQFTHAEGIGQIASYLYLGEATAERPRAVDTHPVVDVGIGGDGSVNSGAVRGAIKRNIQ